MGFVQGNAFGLVRMGSNPLGHRLGHGLARVRLDDPGHGQDLGEESLGRGRVAVERVEVEVAGIPVEEDVADVEQDRVELHPRDLSLTT